MLYDITAGWTGPLDISLLSDGETPAGTMAGMTAALVLQDSQGNAIDTTGDVSIEDAATWVVRYSPDPADLVNGEYRMRVKVTDGAGKVVYFPSGQWDTLRVWVEA